MMGTSMKSLNEINEYVRKERHRVNQKYRLKYH